MELGCTVTVSLTNPDVGDLSLSDTGLEEVLTVLEDEVNQRMTVRLNFFQGEWFLDLSAGTPYYQQILQKGVTDEVIRGVFGAVVKGTEGVSRLIDIQYTLNKSTREMRLSFKAQLEDGSTYVSTNYAPFVILM